MDDSPFRYFIACGALWTVSAMWYDLQEIHAASDPFLLGSPDQLATAALEMVYDASDQFEIPFAGARTIEDFADRWIPQWVALLTANAKVLNSQFSTDDFFSTLLYLYFGFVSSVARRFCALAMNMNLKLNHQTYYARIQAMADEIERQLLHLETKISAAESRAYLRQQRETLSASLSQMWEDTVNTTQTII
jgi:hypothetical protein